MAEKIEQRSEGGTLNWEKTASDYEFQATLSSFVIRIRCNVTNEGADYVLSLTDNQGVNLESISDVELTKMIKRTGVYSKSAFDLMENIFKNAKRHALGVEKALDDILTELNDVPPPF
jgi:hypothetical protein